MGERGRVEIAYLFGIGFQTLNGDQRSLHEKKNGETKFCSLSLSAPRATGADTDTEDEREEREEEERKASAAHPSDASPFATL